jgi:hypothetical protein
VKKVGDTPEEKAVYEEELYSEELKRQTTGK